MHTMERLLESPEEWEVPLAHNQVQQETGQLDMLPQLDMLDMLDMLPQLTRSHFAKLSERQKIFDCMKRLQLTKLNR